MSRSAASRHGRRRAFPAAVIAVTLVLTACGGSGVATTANTDPDRSVAALGTVTPVAEAPEAADLTGLQDALDAVAAGFLAADPEAIAPWLYTPNTTFQQRWLARAENMAAVPFADYRLELDPSLPDLATEAVRDRYDDPVVVVYVTEQLVIEGFDSDGPAQEDLFLTVVRTPDGWRFAGDNDAEPLGLVSVDHLWDDGPVTVTASGPLLFLHHPEAQTLEQLETEAEIALEQANQRWPLAWPRRVPILVPRDQDELGRLLQVTFDLTNFIAFATATPVGEHGSFQLSGSRIMLNPDRFLDRDTDTRRSILVHELVHVATRPAAGPFVPTWLDEGIAQALGEQRSTTGTTLLDAAVADGTLGTGLPLDSDFNIGGRDRIFLSYQRSFSYVSYLAATYGADEVARYYEAVGEGSIGRPGTEQWHIERGAREIFGKPLTELLADWRASLAS